MLDRFLEIMSVCEEIFFVNCFFLSFFGRPKELHELPFFNRLAVVIFLTLIIMSRICILISFFIEI